MENWTEELELLEHHVTFIQIRVSCGIPFIPVNRYIVRKVQVSRYADKKNTPVYRYTCERENYTGINGIENPKSDDCKLVSRAPCILDNTILFL